MLGIARGGLLVGGAIAYALDVKNTFTMNVEFYTGIDERLDMPMICLPFPTSSISARHACSSRTMSPTRAQTLVLVKEFVAGKVGEARVAVLYEKPGSVVNCEYVWRRTDRWIDFPWSADAPVGASPSQLRERHAATPVNCGRISLP